MDTGRQTREFPGYTLAELRHWYANDMGMSPELTLRIKAEIAAREAAKR